MKQIAGCEREDEGHRAVQRREPICNSRIGMAVNKVLFVDAARVLAADDDAIKNQRTRDR